MHLLYEVFIQESLLCNYINDKKIPKENIQSILINKHGCFVLFYWR